MHNSYSFNALWDLIYEWYEGIVSTFSGITTFLSQPAKDVVQWDNAPKWVQSVIDWLVNNTVIGTSSVVGLMLQSGIYIYLGFVLIKFVWDLIPVA